MSFQLLGQGDNQVLINHYYLKVNVSVGQQHEHFLRHLNEILSTIGPSLKQEESWFSSLYFTYGKFPIYNGVPLSMSLKRMSRCSRLNNEGMVNLDSVLSSVSANTSAAVSMSKNLLVPLLPAYLEVYGSVKLHLTTPFYGPSPQKNVEIRILSQHGRQQKHNEKPVNSSRTC
jgi:hypothetical protein